MLARINSLLHICALEYRTTTDIEQILGVSHKPESLGIDKNEVMKHMKVGKVVLSQLTRIRGYVACSTEFVIQ